jgi:ATP-dependent Clp protease ATP-binding subunit ClpA
MFERFTDRAREVVTRAQQEADALHHPHVGTEHLLLAMLNDPASVACTVLNDAGVDRAQVGAEVARRVSPPLGAGDAAALKTIGIDLDTVLDRIKETFGTDARATPPPTSRTGWLRRRRNCATRFTDRAKKVLELSLREALRLGHNYIGTEHILLGLIRDGDGLGAQILADTGISLPDLRAATLAAVGKAA